MFHWAWKTNPLLNSVSVRLDLTFIFRCCGSNMATFNHSDLNQIHTILIRSRAQPIHQLWKNTRTPRNCVSKRYFASCLLQAAECSAMACYRRHNISLIFIIDKLIIINISSLLLRSTILIVIHPIGQADESEKKNAPTRIHAWPLATGHRHWHMCLPNSVCAQSLTHYNTQTHRQCHYDIGVSFS